MSWDPKPTLDNLLSHALSSGLFERVNGHEPTNAPSNGLTAAVWGDRVDPVRSSGLDSTSMRISFYLRVYSSMQQEPKDAIDPNILVAVAALMAAYSADFTLDDEARHIDLLGAHGIPLSAQAGYLRQDGVEFRVMTITIPVIFNDVFEQVA